MGGRLRQGLNQVAHRMPVPGPRGAEATSGATANPLGQTPATEDYRGKPAAAQIPYSMR